MASGEGGGGTPAPAHGELRGHAPIYPHHILRLKGGEFWKKWPMQKNLKGC